MKNIREAKKGEAKKILDLLNSNHNLVDAKNLKYNKNYIKRIISNKLNKVFVYTIKEKIVATVIIELDKKSSYIFLNDLIVREKFRKKGIATKLMDFLITLSKKNKIKFSSGFTKTNNKKIQKMLNKRVYKKGDSFVFYYQFH